MKVRILSLAYSLAALMITGNTLAAALLATSFAGSSTQSVITPVFKALATDAPKPLLVTTNGELQITDGKLVLANSRFTLGALSEAGKVTLATGKIISPFT